MEKVFYREEVFRPFKDVMLSGISISGHINVLKDNFLVRVIVTDKSGGEHLLLEVYDEIYEGRYNPMDATDGFDLKYYVVAKRLQSKRQKNNG